MSMLQMKSVPVERHTIDAQTGDTKRDIVQFGLMPPHPGTCAVCGVKHEPSQPHNAQSMYYQYAFYGEHGRWPTWADAIAHCDGITRDMWKDILTEKNAWSEPEGDAIAHPYEVQP